MNKTPSLCVFDMDGTIIDNEKHNGEAWGKAISLMNLDPSKMQHENFIGRDSGYIKSEMNRIYGNSFSYKKFSESQKMVSNLQTIQLRDGVIDFISYLKNKKIKLCIATSNNRTRTKRLLNHFNILELFSYVITRDDVRFAKPDPEIYILAMNLSLKEKEECFAVEDSEVGGCAAINAGIRVAMIPSTELSNDLSSKAKGTFNSVKSLMKWFDATFRI